MKTRSYIFIITLRRHDEERTRLRGYSFENARDRELTKVYECRANVLVLHPLRTCCNEK